MKKSDKKLERNLVKALTLACERCKDIAPEFEWLTHTINFSRFPQSLRITCVFETELALLNAVEQRITLELTNIIAEELANTGVTLRSIYNHIQFDSEQACHKQHAGDWASRLATH